MDYLNKIKYKIKENGFMHYVRIVNELKRMNCPNTESVIRELNNEPDIHKVRYTNRFLEKYKTRDLYFYNPNKKKNRKQK